MNEFALSTTEVVKYVDPVSVPRAEPSTPQTESINIFHYTAVLLTRLN
jgi:hypothetical protein